MSPNAFARRYFAQATIADETPYTRGEIAVLIGILAIAFGLRVLSANLFPNIHHPDEIFQYLEQGHRLVFGYGVIPWEFRIGLRSWLLPGLLGGVMWIATALGGGVTAYLVAIGCVLSAISTTVVLIAWCWARRVAGPSAAIVAAIVAATWVELVFHGARPLTEVLAASALFAAAFFLCARTTPDRWQILLGGALLGLAFVLRLHLAPAILVVFLWACFGAPLRTWMLLTVGSGAVVAAAGLLDWLTLGHPFQSLWMNFYVNVTQGRADRYGIDPWYGYLSFFIRSLSGAFVPMVVLVLLGARRVPITVVVSLVIVLSHSLIGHKEMRFVFPALPFLLLAAALGLVEFGAALQRAWPHLSRRVLLSGVVAGWVATSIVLAAGEWFRPAWSNHADRLHAFAELRLRNDICGIGLVGLRWYSTGGYVTLHHDVPIYPIVDGATLRNAKSAFDVALAPKESEIAEYGYRPTQCFSDKVCLYEREGQCTPQPAYEINNYLRATDQ